jgi:hypothetical protein
LPCAFERLCRVVGRCRAALMSLPCSGTLSCAALKLCRAFGLFRAFLLRLTATFGRTAMAVFPVVIYWLVVKKSFW